MPRAVYLILLFAQLSAFSELLFASDSKIEWSLQLGDCGVTHIGHVTTVMMGRDSKSWTKPKEQTVVSIIQPSWNYYFFGVGEGGEFAVQGNVYKLSSIHDNAFHQTVVKQHGCTPAGYVTVASAERSVSDKREGAIVLSKAPMDTVRAGSGSCSANIKLNNLSRVEDGSLVADVEWRESSPSPRDPSCNRATPDSKHQIVKIGSIIQTNGYGRLRVESIWPESATHSDWIVLIPEQ